MSGCSLEAEVCSLATVWKPNMCTILVQRRKLHKYTLHICSHELAKAFAAHNFTHMKAKFPDKFLHVIRYNPHNYKQDGTTIKHTPEQRVASIKASLAYVPNSQFVITYLYYRCTGHSPAITSDPGYTLGEFVRQNNAG